MQSRRTLATVLALGLSLVPAPGSAWDRGVRARGAARAADQLWNKHAYHEALAKYRAFLAERGDDEGEKSLRIWSQVAECCEKIGRYKEALEARAHALGLALALDDRAGVAANLRHMGETHAFLGDYDRSLGLIGLSREVPPGASAQQEKAEAYRSLAVAYGALGRFEEMRAAAEAAQALFVQLGDASGESAALNSMAVYHQSQGHFDTALEFSGKSIDAAKRSPYPDLAPVYLTKAGIHRARGEMREALRVDQDALEAAKAGGVSEAVAVAQANLGLDEMAFGEYEKAREAIQSALTAFAASGAADDEARMRLELGRVDFYDRHYADALVSLAEARRLFESTHQPVGVGVADAATGRVLEAMGRFPESLAAHDRALELFRSTREAVGIARESVERGFALAGMGRMAAALNAFGTPGSDAAEGDIGWRAMQGRGRVLAASGDVTGAVDAYRKAADLVERQLARSSVPEFRSSFLAGEDRLKVYDEAVELLASQGRAPDAFDFAERCRARSFLDLVASASLDLRAGVDAGLLGQERALKQRITSLSAQAARQGEQAATSRGGNPFDDELTSLRAEYDTLLGRISSSSPGLASLVSVKPEGLPAVSAALAPGEVALYYYLGPTRAWAFSFGKGGVAMTALPMPSRELRALARVFRIQLEQRIPSDETARKLHRALIRPVASRMGSAPLVVIPHDVLHYVPFAALMDDRGRCLLEDHAIAYAPSGSSLVRIAKRQAPSTGTKLVAFGAPETGAAAPALPTAAAEVQRVASHFPGALVLIGKDASEAALKREAGSADVLHLACHGTLEPDMPLYSGLYLTPGENEDGRLELHEIFGMRLKCRLAVLSACETALGHLSRGDELVCLSRALLYAGSKSVMASLWSVADESTATLMDAFHTRLAAGASPSEAIRQAALQLKKTPKFGEPYFWASFTLSGK